GAPRRREGAAQGDPVSAGGGVRGQRRAGTRRRRGARAGQPRLRLPRHRPPPRRVGGAAPPGEGGEVTGRFRPRPRSSEPLKKRERVGEPGAVQLIASVVGRASATKSWCP